MFSQRKPSRALYTRQRPCDNAFKPLGVANHIVPSELSRIEAIVFDDSPFAVVYVVNLPPLSLLTPPLSVCKTVLCPWTESAVYRFGGGSDGAYPIGQLVFDQAGDIFGTTFDARWTSCDAMACTAPNVVKLPARGA